MANINTDVLIAGVAAIAAMIDEGEENEWAQVIIYGGDMPADIDGTVSGDNVMLALFDVPSPLFGPPQVVGNAVEALAVEIEPVIGDDTGEATFYRVYNRDGVALFQKEVGDGLTLNQNFITKDANVSVESFVIGMPIV